MHKYAADINEAYYEPGKDRSVELWQAIFGDGFHAPPPTTSGGKFGALPPATPVRSNRAG
jgi:hypothetical protein